jgi:dynactin 1
MFFQRLAAKTDLIDTVVAQTHGLPDSLNGSVSDMLVGICEVPLYFCSHSPAGLNA